MTQELDRRTGTRPLVTAVLLVGLVVVFSGPVAAHTGDAGIHRHDDGMGSNGGAFGSLWMVLLTVVLIGIPPGLSYGE